MNERSAADARVTSEARDVPHSSRLRGGRQTPRRRPRSRVRVRHRAVSPAAHLARAPSDAGEPRSATPIRANLDELPLWVIGAAVGANRDWSSGALFQRPESRERHIGCLTDSLDGGAAKLDRREPSRLVRVGADSCTTPSGAATNAQATECAGRANQRCAAQLPDEAAIPCRAAGRARGANVRQLPQRVSSAARPAGVARLRHAREFHRLRSQRQTASRTCE